MLLPPGPGPHPAVLLLQDHGSAFAIGKEKVVTPWDDQAARPSGRRLAGAALRRRFARRGAAGAWLRRARRRRPRLGVAAGQRLRGAAGAGRQPDAVRPDARRGDRGRGRAAWRWLARHPAVDPRRVGVLGFSFGGYRAWQAAALCPQVSAGVAASWMGRLGDLMQPGGNQLRGQSAFAMLHPALAGRLDYPDVAGLAAPKPMLFCPGRQTATSRPRPPKGRRGPAAHLAGCRRRPGVATEITEVPTPSRWRQQTRAAAFLERRWRRRP